MKLVVFVLFIFFNARTTGQSLLDPSFAGDGIFVHHDFNVDGCSFQDLEVQPDGKLVVLGCETILRLLSDGTPDAAFNSPVIDLFDGNLDQVRLDQLDRIVTVGSQSVGFDTRPVVLRFLSNGDPDLQFGNNGIAQPTSLANGRFIDVEFASDGGIFLLGYREAFPDPISILVKLTAPGSLDLTFNGSGSVDILPIPNSIAYDFVRSPMGDLYFTGGSSGGSYVAAYTSQGTLNTLFNGTGLRLFTGDFASPRISLSSDDALLMSYMRTDVWENNAVGLVKILNDGQLAASFGQAGIWETSWGVDHHFMPRKAISNGTGILLAGHFLRMAGPVNDHPFFISLTHDGAVNEEIGDNGLVADTLNFCSGGSQEAVRDPFGRIFFWGANVGIGVSNEAIVLAYLNHSVGIDDIEHESLISLSPNPSRSSVKIQHSFSGAVSVSIYDCLGRGILQLPATQPNSTFDVDLSDLNAGLYWVTLSNTECRRTEKLIIE